MVRKLTRALFVTGALLVRLAGQAAADVAVPNRPSQDAYAVIDAVNAIRLGQGLPPYTVSPILMSVAQAQAEYMASSGDITHTGPDGSRPYQRGLAAGYPLAGQIPPGFYSENIVGGPDMSPQTAVQIWTGDAPHMNTMASPNLQEIGAGVAVSGGMVYYVIDCARPTTSGLPQAYTPGAAESSFSSSNELIMPVTKSTPNAAGELIHEVQAGQSLWQIAIEYGVKIDQIRALNALPAEYLINPGDTLLIMTVGTPTPVPSTPTEKSSPTVRPEPTTTPGLSLTPSVTFTTTSAPAGNIGGGSGGLLVAGIIVVALAAAALIAWAGRARIE